MTKTWRRLAEALGIPTEGPMKFSKLGQQRNMSRYGTMDRRDKQGPMYYFNTKGTGAAQGGPQLRQATKAPPPIPTGGDDPRMRGQVNPLMKPSGLGVPVRRPDPMAQGSSDDWPGMVDPDEDER